MKLIANLFCRKRFKVQFRIRRWLAKFIKSIKMKKTVIHILLFLMIASPCWAINIFEKLLLRRDTIKMYDAKILVNRITKDIKYMWYRYPGGGGHWVAVTGPAKDRYQTIYNLQDKNLQDKKQE